MRDEKKQDSEAYTGDGTHPITTPDLPIRRFRRLPNLGRRFLKGDLAEHGFGNQRYFDREKSQGSDGQTQNVGLVRRMGRGI